MSIRTFLVEGEVQGVMFRQTLIRAAQRRNLKGGATNLPNRSQVRFTLEGDNEKIQEIISFLESGRPINDWDARIISVSEEPGPAPQHEVTTENVDKFRWSQNVKMFL
jgi:acylphosphatase